MTCQWNMPVSVINQGIIQVIIKTVCRVVKERKAGCFPVSSFGVRQRKCFFFGLQQGACKHGQVPRKYDDGKMRESQFGTIS